MIGTWEWIFVSFLILSGFIFLLKFATTEINMAKSTLCPSNLFTNFNNLFDQLETLQPGTELWLSLYIPPNTTHSLEFKDGHWLFKARCESTTYTRFLSKKIHLTSKDVFAPGHKQIYVYVEDDVIILKEG